MLRASHRVDAPGMATIPLHPQIQEATPSFADLPGDATGLPAVRTPQR